MCDGMGGAGKANAQDPVACENPRYRKLTDGEVESIASFVHEANRMYQERNGEPASPPWGQAEEWQRTSVRKGVRFVLETSKYPRNIGHSDAEESHNSWLEEKLRNHWTWGTTKDEAARTHPCCLPYAALPAWQRRKDVLFRALCEALDPRREV